MEEGSKPNVPLPGAEPDVVYGRVGDFVTLVVLIGIKVGVA